MAFSRELGLTLQLLAGPSKALVASAVGGVAVDLALSSGNPAHCLLYSAPYDDEAFKSMYGTPKQQALASSKPQRPVGLAALAKLTTPGHVAVTFGRNIGLATLITVNKWLAAALEEEEAAEAESREPVVPQLSIAELGAACNRGAYNACVDLTVQATRAALDARAAAKLPADLAKRLIKDLRQSAVRKGRLPWYSRPLRVAKTAAFSEATWWAADFLVSCMLEAYAAMRKAGGSWQQRLRRMALRCGLHGVRAGLVLGAVAVGNGVGSASPRARPFSMWLSAMAASFLVNGYMSSLMNRYAPLAPAGGDGAAAAGGGAGAGVPQPRQQQQAAAGGRGGGIVLVGQQVQPAAGAAAPADAAVQAGGNQLADGPLDFPEQQQAEPAAAVQLEQALDAGLEAAVVPAAAAAAAPAQQMDAGVQAGAPGAAEPPIPAPQQRRVVGGPRLPERPARRNAAAGPGPEVDGMMGNGIGPAVPAPPPAAPPTPQFRTERAPTPAQDSEEAEARAAAAAGASSGTPAAARASSSGSSEGAGASQAIAGGASPGGSSSDASGLGTKAPSAAVDAVAGAAAVEATAAGEPAAAAQDLVADLAAAAEPAAAAAAGPGADMAAEDVAAA